MTKNESTNDVNLDFDDGISDISNTGDEDEITKLRKKIKIQSEQIVMLKQQKTMEEYKSKILKEDNDKLQNSYSLLSEMNTKNIAKIEKLHIELNDYKGKSKVKKIKGNNNTYNITKFNIKTSAKKKQSKLKNHIQKLLMYQFQIQIFISITAQKKTHFYQLLKLKIFQTVNTN